MKESPPACVDNASSGRHRALRSQWRTASLAAGWPFPSDWASNSVDVVCHALATGQDPVVPLGELGAARAEAGVGLSGTLHDLAALHTVATTGHDGLVPPDPDAVPSRLLRATALGWAEAVAGKAVGCEVEDPLTGLTTTAYLRTRLHEIYRAARAAKSAPNSEHALLTVTVGLADDVLGYSRMMAMVLAADVLRSVFDSGETLSLMRGSTAAVLAVRDDSLNSRCERVRVMTAQRLIGDPALRTCGPVRVREEELPAEHSEACELLSTMS